MSLRSPFASDLTRTLREPLRSFDIAGRTPGLEIVYEPADDAVRQPLLERLIVRSVQTLDIAIELLADGRLDAAALPASVNLIDRLRARGLDASVRLGDEVVYLDLRGTDLDVPARRSLAASTGVAGLEAAFVRDLGRPTSTLHPAGGAGGTRGPFRAFPSAADVGNGRRITLAAPVGDELLALLQRALHDDWERKGFEVDVVTIDSRTFYGDWAAEPPIDVALRRARATGLPADRAAFERMSAVPLFHMSSVVAWRDGVHGVTAPGRGEGPLAHAERWWIDG